MCYDTVLVLTAPKFLLFLLSSFLVNGAWGHGGMQSCRARKVMISDYGYRWVVSKFRWLGEKRERGRRKNYKGSTPKAGHQCVVATDGLRYLVHTPRN